MKQLFKRYIDEGKISEALMVGQNILNKDISDYECFDMYFDLLMSIVGDASDVSAEKFLQKAAGALDYFAENVELDVDIVNYIRNKEETIEDARKRFIKERIKENDDVIELLKKLLKKLRDVSSKSQFDKTINQISEVDAVIKTDYLSERQHAEYSALTKQCSELVNRKMKVLEEDEKIDYNLRAIESYEKVFQYFKSKEVVSEHKEIIKALFEFDSSQLYNETLIYYNHVYNYILSKLSDDEKFVITKYAIMSEKRSRG